MSDDLRERIARAYKGLVGPHVASDGDPFIRMPTADEVADAVLAVLPEYEQVGWFSDAVWRDEVNGAKVCGGLAFIEERPNWPDLVPVYVEREA